jgi:hypothetical protein
MASGSIVPRKQVGHMLHQPALQRRSKNPLPMEAQGRFDRSLAQGFGRDRGIESRDGGCRTLIYDLLRQEMYGTKG